MQAAISRMAVASAPTGEAAWQAAALPNAITGDPWELEGALSALADVFAQLFPLLAIPPWPQCDRQVRPTLWFVHLMPAADRPI